MNSEQYGKFAAVYDTMGADQHSRDMCKYLARISGQFDIDPVSVLDLCCGTGTALSIFADYGWEVSGLDGSADMLAVARRKLGGRTVSLYRQELPRFRIPMKRGGREVRRFDLITCFYDSLNYLLSEAKLLAAFRSVARHVHPHGWFVFDMNTPNALKTIWDSNVYAGTGDTMAWIWKNRWYPEKKSALCEATFFVKNGKQYERFTELHWEKGYANSVIKRLLRTAGFSIRGFYRCHTFNKPDRDTNRICAVAQRKV